MATTMRATMATNRRAMITETSFMTTKSDPMHLLKIETIDRLESVVDELPKYKTHLEKLIVEFSIEDLLCLMNTIYRDNDFTALAYNRIYNEYFDEIEDLIHTHNLLKTTF